MFHTDIWCGNGHKRVQVEAVSRQIPFTDDTWQCYWVRALDEKAWKWVSFVKGFVNNVIAMIAGELTIREKKPLTPSDSESKTLFSKKKLLL